MNSIPKKPLGSLCEILDKQRKPITKRDRKPGPFPYYGASGILDYVEGYLFDEELVLVGEDGAKWCAGESTAYAISGKSWVNNHAHVLRPIQNTILDSWLIYYLNFADLSKFITGLTVPKLNQAKLREIPVPTPSIDEQKSIVAILDEAFAGIDTAIVNTEKNLANVRELFESYLNSVFTRKGASWKDVAIGDIAHVKGGKRVPKGYKLQTEPTQHPYISVSDFNDTGSVDLGKVKYIIEDVYQKISRYTISSEDLYISIAGTIGKSGVIPKELEGANLTENACKLVLDKGVSNRYIYFFTRTESFKEQALKNTRTAAQPKLALERLKTIRLSLPSLETQLKLIGQFNELWSKTQELELIYKKRFTALAELKQCLLHKAFSGELATKTEKEVEQAVA